MTNYSSIKKVALTHDIDPNIIEALLLVETGGSGFFKDWNGRRRIKIQFEPHVFVRELKKIGVNARLRRARSGMYTVLVNEKVILRNKVDRQFKEWSAFNAAWEVDKTCTMLATSWGLGQIMGFNYKLAGFDSVDDMVTDFKKSEEVQLNAMLVFIQNTNLLGKLKRKDWKGFARGYNGKYYYKYKYDTRLNDAYNRAKKI